MSGKQKIELVLLLLLVLVMPILGVNSESLSGTDVDENIIVANDLAEIWRRPETERAIYLYLDSANKVAKKGDRIRSSVLRRNASELMLRIGLTDQAIRITQRSLDVDRSLGNVDGEAVASAFLAYLYSVQGNSAKQVQFLRRTLTLKNHVMDQSTLGLVNMYLGEVYYSLENFPKLLEHFELAAAQFEKGTDLNLKIRSNTALVYGYLANELLEKASQTAIYAYGLATQTENQRGKTLALVALGLVQFKLGQSSESLASLRQAEKAFPANIDRSERAVLVYNIGRVYEYFDDCDSSISFFENSLELFELDRNEDLTVGNLWSLGKASRICGRFSQADRYLRRALTLATKHGKAHATITTHLELAELYFLTGDFHRARSNLSTARSLDTMKNYPWAMARVDFGIGRFYAKQGNFEMANEHFSRSQETFHRIKDRFLESDVYFARGSLNRTRDRGKAIVDMRTSLELSEQLLSNSVSERLDRSYFIEIYNRYSEYVDLLMTDPANSNAAFSAVERSKAPFLIEHIRSLYAIADVDSETLRKERELIAALNSKADRLSDLLALRADQAEIQRLESEIDRIESGLDEVKAAIKLKNPIYSAMKDPLPFDLADFQANAVRIDDVFLEYFFGKEKSFVWLVENDQIEAFVLPDKEKIEGKIDVLKVVLDERKPREGELFEDRQARIAEADAKYAVAARELSDMILGPVADKIRGKRLIVVPDGGLNYFPISALPMPNSESDDPILLTNEVIYQPSAQTYALLKKIGQEKKDGPTKDLLVFSDPVFNPADERLTGVEVAAEKPDEQYRFRLVESFSSLSRLPATKTEAETVSNAVGGSDLFMGFDATRDRLLSTNLADYRVVHLATHGFLDPERPELSSLVFSRYDQTGKQINESIRMQDIYSMKLNADLVVLSACQTGTGKEIKGEGVMGLNTAFLQAGARSVVSTLWQVEDNAANQLMKEFYVRMVSDGMSPSAALRAAQIKLYRDPQFRSPFFWAAFTVHGDAATATPFKRDHTKLAIGISAAVLVGFVGFMLLRRRRYRTSKV